MDRRLPLRCSLSTARSKGSKRISRRSKGRRAKRSPRVVTSSHCRANSSHSKTTARFRSQRPQPTLIRSAATCLHCLNSFACLASIDCRVKRKRFSAVRLQRAASAKGTRPTKQARVRVQLGERGRGVAQPPNAAPKRTTVACLRRLVARHHPTMAAQAGVQLLRATKPRHISLRLRTRPRSSEPSLTRSLQVQAHQFPRGR